MEALYASLLMGEGELHEERDGREGHARGRCWRQHDSLHDSVVPAGAGGKRGEREGEVARERARAYLGRQAHCHAFLALRVHRGRALLTAAAAPGDDAGMRSPVRPTPSFFRASVCASLALLKKCDEARGRH